MRISFATFAAGVAARRSAAKTAGRIRAPGRYATPATPATMDVWSIEMLVGTAPTRLKPELWTKDA